MVELFSRDIRTEYRQSSKGNQLKWFNGDTWYKADYTGYEGLVEYIISGLLERTSLPKEAYVKYDTEKIIYKQNQYNGCTSKNFIPKGWSLITLERLFKNEQDQSLQKSIVEIEDCEERIRFLVNQIIQITGLKEFGNYLSMLLALDAFFLNEDRHMHNIAVLMDDKLKFHYCPIFDNGASLLADTTIDYPLTGNLDEMISAVISKTICPDFDKQLDVAEKLYGNQVQLKFTKNDIQELLEKEKYYPKEVKDRVYEILMKQCRKYQYLFQ